MHGTNLFEWRGVTYRVAHCFPEARAAALASRWPGGVVDLLQIVTESPQPGQERSPRARLEIAIVVLEAAGEPVPASIGAGVALSRDKQAVQLAELAAHMTGLLQQPAPTPEAAAQGLKARPSVEVVS